MPVSLHTRAPALLQERKGSDELPPCNSEKPLGAPEDDIKKLQQKGVKEWYHEGDVHHMQGSKTHHQASSQLCMTEIVAENKVSHTNSKDGDLVWHKTCEEEEPSPRSAVEEPLSEKLHLGRL